MHLVSLLYLFWQNFFFHWQEGVVYAVEFSHWSGRDLVNMAKKRTNVIPIIKDTRHPAKSRMLVGMVDVIFSDVAQPDQVLPFLIIPCFLNALLCSYVALVVFFWTLSCPCCLTFYIFYSSKLNLSNITNLWIDFFDS